MTPPTPRIEFVTTVPVSVNPWVPPAPLDQPATMNGNTWTGSLTVTPPANAVSVAYYQAYFPPPFNSQAAPLPAAVEITGTVSGRPPQPGDPLYSGTFTGPSGWVIPSFWEAPGNAEMAFIVSKGANQNWPTPMLVTITITNTQGGPANP